MTKKRLVGFNFPYNNDGEVSGINNPGIETFRRDPITSLTKETIQNALDAKSTNSNAPVEVKFNLSYIDRSIFPYIDQFHEILTNCKNYWSDNKKASDIIDASLNVLKENTIPVLEISDFNTTGLKGAKENKNSSFKNLVKSSGSSDKSDDAGGSFGIGKNAPFACSLLRFVIYSTLDEDNIKALQGVAKLATHLHNNFETQGTGYLGITTTYQNGISKNLPFVDSDFDSIDVDIDPYFIRNDIGTSLFVMGFFETENWKQSIIKSTVETYLLAIYENKLEVSVDDIKINKATLDSIIKKYFTYEEDLLTISYYNALLTEPIVETFRNLGTLKLYILVEKDLPKRIAYVRSNGMKIIDKDRFRIPQQFSGVLKFEGKELNKFIRSLENPSHDEIQARRYNNPKKAESILSEISKWITSKLKDFNDLNSNEIFNMDWLSNCLPGKTNENSNVEIKESIHKSISQFMINTIKTPAKGKKVTNDHTSKVKDEDSENSSTTSNNHVDDNKDNSKDNKVKDKNKSKIKPIEIKRSRIFSLYDKCKYKAIIESATSGNTYLELRTIGEDGKLEESKLKTIKDSSGNDIAIKNHGIFGPIKFKKNETKHFEFEVDDFIRCAWEVSVYENNV